MENNIAVCISGLAGAKHIIGKDIVKNVERNKKLLNFPFYFSHWKGYGIELPYDCLYLEEPKLHYHCILDIEKNMECETWNRYKNYKVKNKPGLYDTSKKWVNQMLAHSRLVNTIPEKYNIIIRLRYDSYLNSSVDFLKYIEEVETDNIPIGVSSFNYGEDKLQKIPYNELKPVRHQPKDCVYCKGEFLWDHMIIHKREHLVNVEELFLSNKLMASEWGWYQILAGQHNIPFKNIENLAIIIRKLQNAPDFT